MVKDPASTVPPRSAQRVVAQGEAHPHPGGRDRRHPARAGRARSDVRVAAARHPRSRRPAVRGAGRHGIQRLDPAHARCARSTPLHTDRESAASACRRWTRAGVQWVRPELVGEVEFGEFTPGGILRHSRWRGLRPDKSPAEVVREAEPPVASTAAAPSLRDRVHRDGCTAAQACASCSTCPAGSSWKVECSTSKCSLRHDCSRCRIAPAWPSASAAVVDDDVRGEHRRSAGELPHVHVVTVHDPRGRRGCGRGSR